MTGIINRTSIELSFGRAHNSWTTIRKGMTRTGSGTGFRCFGRIQNDYIPNHFGGGASGLPLNRRPGAVHNFNTTYDVWPT
jgi:hypothetical protein